jgi:hypothetical protein
MSSRSPEVLIYRPCDDNCKNYIVIFSNGAIALYWARASSFSRLHGHIQALNSVGLLSTSDQSEAEVSTRQNTTLTRRQKIIARRDSNPQSQQAPSTAQPLRVVLSRLGRTLTDVVQRNKVISTIFNKQIQTIVV